MKIIPSEVYRLRRDNTALECRVAVLEAELARVNALYKHSWATVQGGRRRTTRGSTQTFGRIKRISTSPSYLQPTKSSAERSKFSASKEIRPGAPRPAESTTGVRKETKNDRSGPNFMKPTTSSRAKTKLPEVAHRWCDSWETADTTSWTDSCSEESDSCYDANNNVERCSYCDGIVARNETDQSLKARSKLDQPHLIHSVCTLSIRCCPLPFRFQSRLKKTALRLAQEALWLALRTHWPEIQRQYYLEGPEQVKFGRDELHCSWVDSTVEDFDCREGLGAIANRAMDVVNLRNAVCHPGHCSAEQLDRLLYYAQALTVAVNDDKRAFKIRAMRDQLYAKAKEEYAEIEARVGLLELPFAQPWPLHWQYFFDDLQSDPDHRRFPTAIKMAIKDWNSKYVRPGEWDPAYLANVARKKLDFADGAEESAGANRESLELTRVDSLDVLEVAVA